MDVNISIGKYADISIYNHYEELCCRYPFQQKLSKLLLPVLVSQTHYGSRMTDAPRSDDAQLVKQPDWGSALWNVGAAASLLCGYGCMALTGMMMGVGSLASVTVAVLVNQVFQDNQRLPRALKLECAGQKKSNLRFSFEYILARNVNKLCAGRSCPYHVSETLNGVF